MKTNTEKINGVPAVGSDVIEAELKPLIDKFDRLSPKGKQQMIDSLGRKATAKRIEKHAREPFSDFGRQVIKDIKDYFQERKAQYEN